MACIIERKPLVGQSDAVGFACWSQCDGGCHAVGTVALRTAVVIDHDLLVQSEVQCAVVAGSHQNHVLQRARSFGVACCGCHVTAADDNGGHHGVNRLVFRGALADVSLDGEQVVALSQRQCFAEVDCHVGKSGALAQLCLTLPNGNLGDVCLCAFQVEFHGTHRQRILVALSLDVDIEQFLVGSPDRSVGSRCLSGFDGLHLHGLYLILADGSLETGSSRISRVGIERYRQCSVSGC